MKCENCEWETTEDVDYCERCGVEFPPKIPWWEKALQFESRPSKIKYKKVLN